MMEDFFPEAMDAESYEGCRAEVRWCRIISLDKNEKFKVWVKYDKAIIR